MLLDFSSLGVRVRLASARWLIPAVAWTWSLSAQAVSGGEGTPPALPDPSSAPAPTGARPSEPERETPEATAVAPDSTATSGDETPGIEFIPLNAAAVRIRLGGYIQAQYQNDQASRDLLLPGGTPQNLDGFVLRRARLRAVTSWKHLRAVLEFDGNTVRGPNVGIHRAEVSWSLVEDASRPSPLVVTVGLTDIPFGHELRLPAPVLPFMERSTGSQAFFPGLRDVGARIHGALGWFRYDVAVQNGAITEERNTLNPLNPSGAPDFVGRLGVDVAPVPALHVVAGLSALLGTGFSPGVEATKPQLVWRDLDGDGNQQDNEIIAIPGQTALAAATWRRWGVGADVSAALRTPIGVSRLWVEGILGSNLDRGLFVADPVLSTYSQRGVSALAAVMQDLWTWGFVGVRASLYRPDLDLFSPRQGLPTPVNPKSDVLAILVGLRWSPDVHIAAQYDIVSDHLGRDATGAVTDLANNRLTIRTQVRF